MKRRGNNKPVTTNSDLKIRAFYNKPRHGLALECPACGWKYVGGGFETTGKRNKIEKDIRDEHKQVHQDTFNKKQLRTVTVEENGQFVQKIPELKISKSTHKVEAEHDFVVQSTKQTTTSTTYSTPTGCTIASSVFDAGEMYLHVVTATIDNTSTGAETRVRCVSGSSVYADSEQATEIDSGAGNTHTYMWWTMRTAQAGEDFHVELATSTGSATAGIDQVCIFVLRLTPDFVINTDFAYHLDTANTTMSVNDTDTTTNNAFETFTPTVAGHRWLILSKARYGAGIASQTSPQSRISRSGEASDNDTIVQQEGEDSTNSMHVLCGARVDTLGAVSNTYTEISKNIGTTTFASVVRTHSGIFVMDLDLFKNVAVNQEDGPQEEPNSTTTPHGVLVHSQALTPAQVGDVWVLAHCTMGNSTSGSTFTMRLQVDDTDQPATQSTDDYNYNCWAPQDRVCWATQTVMENLSAASHTADIDGGIMATGSNRGTFTRLLMLTTMEYAASAGITNVKNETEAITENIVISIGTAGVQVENETVSISETVIPRVTSSLVLIQDENIVFRMSGGTTNTNLANSRGGARSTQAGGVLSNKLFDDVTLTEATTGDIEYRCFYILNAHTTLTASDVRVWIPTNTPAQDEIHIARGSSAVNGTEQGPLTDEQTAPSSVTFVTANSEATAINCENLPPGQHRAIWLRRTVPSNASFFPENSYQLQVSLYSDHT